MPSFVLDAVSGAPVEEVWKLLFDPTRFPEWWVGIERVRTDGAGGYTQWPTGYPDFPMPQKLLADRGEGRVTVSCQVSDIEFVWQLTEAGAGTAIHVDVTLPEAEAHRYDDQHEMINDSLHRLTKLAESGR